MSKATEVVVYSPNEATLVEAAAKARGLRIAGVEDRKGYALVHERRMELKGFRVSIEKTRKDLKADALEYGRRVDAEAKRLTALIEPAERELEAEEERIDAEKAALAAIEAATRRKHLDARMAALAAVGCQAVPSEIEDMGEHEFAGTLQAATEVHNERMAAERLAAAERARVAAEEAAARKAEQARTEAERNRRRLEEERAQQEERERLAAAQAELERQQAIQREEAARLASERREFAAEMERQKEAQREASAAELRKAQEAQWLARQDKLKPEIERVRTFAASVAGMEVPPVWCADAIRCVLIDARDQILALAESGS
jgi:hypothetical protein